MDILNHKRIVCFSVAVAMVFTQVVPAGWSDVTTLQNVEDKSSATKTLEEANQSMPKNDVKLENDPSTTFFEGNFNDQDSALTAADDEKKMSVDIELERIVANESKGTGEVLLGIGNLSDGTIDDEARERVMGRVEEMGYKAEKGTAWVLVRGFENESDMNEFMATMGFDEDVKYAEENKYSDFIKKFILEHATPMPAIIKPIQREVAFPNQLTLNDGEKVQMDVEYFVDVLKIMMNKARRDSGEFCVAGNCSTVNDLMLLKGINQVFTMDKLRKFDSFSDGISAGNPSKFTNKGWIDFTTELLSKYKKADLDIFEGMLIASKSMLMADSKFSFGVTASPSYISGYSDFSLLKKPEVLLRTISPEKVWALIKNGADVLENSTLPQEVLEALALHLGVNFNDIADLVVSYKDYQWNVAGSYPKNGVLQHFAGLVEDRFRPLEAVMMTSRDFQSVSMFEGNPADLIQFDEAQFEVYGLPVPVKKPDIRLNRFYVSVVDADSDITAEAAIEIANELGKDLNDLVRINITEQLNVCMAMNVCPSQAWAIAVEAKDGFIYKGSLSYYPNRKEAYRVSITEVIPAMSPVEKAILESLSETFNLSMDELKGLVKFQTLKDGSMDVYFAKTKHVMGDDRIINVLGSNALPSFANFKFLITLCKPSPGFSCEGSAQVVSARMEWPLEDNKMPNALIDYDSQGRIERVQWLVDEKTSLSREVCGDGFCVTHKLEGTTFTHFSDVHLYFWGKNNALKIEIRTLPVAYENIQRPVSVMDENGQIIGLDAVRPADGQMSDAEGYGPYPLPVPINKGLKGAVTFHFDGENHYVNEYIEYDGFGNFLSKSVFEWFQTPDRIAYCLPAPGQTCEHDVQKGERMLTSIIRQDVNGKVISRISAADPAARYIQMPNLGQSGVAFVFVTGDDQYSQRVEYKNFEDLLAQVKLLEKNISALSPVEKAAIEKLSEVMGIPFDTLKKLVKTRVSQDKKDFGTVYLTFISDDGQMGNDRSIDPLGDSKLPNSVSFNIKTEQMCTTGIPAHCSESHTFRSMNMIWSSIEENTITKMTADFSFDTQGRIQSAFWSETHQGVDRCSGEVCTTVAYPIISGDNYFDSYEYNKEGLTITRRDNILYSRLEEMPLGISVVDENGNVIGSMVDAQPEFYPLPVPSQGVRMKIYMQGSGEDGYFVNKVEEFKDGVVVATTAFLYLFSAVLYDCAEGFECIPPAPTRNLVSATRTSHTSRVQTKAEIRDGNLAVISIRDYAERLKFNGLEELIEAMARIEEEHRIDDVPMREEILTSLVEVFGYSRDQAELLIQNASISDGGMAIMNDDPSGRTYGYQSIVLNPGNVKALSLNKLFPLNNAGSPSAITFNIRKKIIPPAPCAVDESGSEMGNCPGATEIIEIQNATVDYEMQQDNLSPYLQRQVKLYFRNNIVVNATHYEFTTDPLIRCIKAPCGALQVESKMSFEYESGQIHNIRVVYSNVNDYQKIGLKESLIEMQKIGMKNYPKEVIDIYEDGEKVKSEIVYLVLEAVYDCAEGQECIPPAPTAILNYIQRSSEDEKGVVSKLSIIQDLVISFRGNKEPLSGGSFREHLNQAKVFEDKILNKNEANVFDEQGRLVKQTLEDGTLITLDWNSHKATVTHADGSVENYFDVIEMGDEVNRTEEMLTQQIGGRKLITRYPQEIGGEFWQTISIYGRIQVNDVGILYESAFSEGSLVVKKEVNSDGEIVHIARILDPDGNVLREYFIEEGFDVEQQINVRTDLIARGVNGEEIRFVMLENDNQVNADFIQTRDYVDSETFEKPLLRIIDRRIYRSSIGYQDLVTQLILHDGPNLKMSTSRNFDENGVLQFEQTERYAGDAIVRISNSTQANAHGDYENSYYAFKVEKPAGQVIYERSFFGGQYDSIYFDNEKSSLLTGVTIAPANVEPKIQIKMTADDVEIIGAPYIISEMQFGPGRLVIIKDDGVTDAEVFLTEIRVPDASKDEGYRVLEVFKASSFSVSEYNGAISVSLQPLQDDSEWAYVLLSDTGAMTVAHEVERRFIQFNSELIATKSGFELLLQSRWVRDEEHLSLYQEDKYTYSEEGNAVQVEFLRHGTKNFGLRENIETGAMTVVIYTSFYDNDNAQYSENEEKYDLTDVQFNYAKPESLMVISSVSGINSDGEKITFRLKVSQNDPLYFTDIEIINEDEILHKETLQKMNNVLVEIQTMANKFNELDKKVQLLNGELATLDQILSGEKITGGPIPLMMRIQFGHEVAINQLTNWIKDYIKAMENNDQKTILEIQNKFTHFIDKEPYELGENEGNREVFLSGGQSYREVLRELDGLIVQAKKFLVELPVKVKNLQDEISLRSKTWEKEATEKLENFGDLILSFEPSLNANGSWGSDSWKEFLTKDTAKLWYGGSPGYVMVLERYHLWMESRSFDVTLANGEKMSVEFRNGIVEPKFDSLLRSMKNFASAQGVQASAVKVVIPSMPIDNSAQRQYLPDLGLVVKGFRHFFSVGNGLDQTVGIFSSEYPNNTEVVKQEASMSLRNLTNAMMIESDLNKDGVVDAKDITTLIQEMASQGFGLHEEGQLLMGDLNKDGVSDISDMAIILAVIEASKLNEGQFIQIARNKIESMHLVDLPNPISETQITEMNELMQRVEKEVRAILENLKNDLNFLIQLQQKNEVNEDGKLIVRPMMSFMGSPAALKLETHANKLMNDLYNSIMKSNVVIENEYDLGVELPIQDMIKILTEELKNHEVGLWGLEENYLVLKGLNEKIVGQFTPRGGHLYNIFQKILYGLAYGPSQDNLRDMMIRFFRTHGELIVTDGKLDLVKFRKVLVYGSEAATRLIVSYSGGEAFIDWSSEEEGKLTRTDVETGEAVDFMEATDVMSCSYPANGPALCAGIAFPGPGFEQVGSYKKNLADGGYEDRIIFGRRSDFIPEVSFPTKAEEVMFSELELMKFSGVDVNHKTKTHEYTFETIAPGVINVTMMFTCQAPEGMACKPSPARNFIIRLEEGIATFAPVEIDLMGSETEFVVPAPGSFKFINIPAEAEFVSMFEKANSREYSFTGSLRELTGPSTLMRTAFEFTAINEKGEKQIFIIDGRSSEDIADKLRHAIAVSGGQNIAMKFVQSMMLEGVQLYTALSIQNVSVKKYPADYFNGKDFEDFRATFSLKIGDKGYNDRYDFNDDGVVGVSDFGFFRSHYKGDTNSPREYSLTGSLRELTGPSTLQRTAFEFIANDNSFIDQVTLDLMDFNKDGKFDSEDVSLAIQIFHSADLNRDGRTNEADRHYLLAMIDKMQTIVTVDNTPSALLLDGVEYQVVKLSNNTFSFVTADNTTFNSSSGIVTLNGFNYKLTENSATRGVALQFVPDDVLDINSDGVVNHEDVNSQAILLQHAVDLNGDGFFGTADIDFMRINLNQMSASDGMSFVIDGASPEGVAEKLRHAIAKNNGQVELTFKQSITLEGILLHEVIAINRIAVADYKASLIMSLVQDTENQITIANFTNLQGDVVQQEIFGGLHESIEGLQAMQRILFKEGLQLIQDFAALPFGQTILQEFSSDGVLIRQDIYKEILEFETLEDSLRTNTVFPLENQSLVLNYEQNQTWLEKFDSRTGMTLSREIYEGLAQGSDISGLILIGKVLIVSETDLIYFDFKQNQTTFVATNYQTGETKQTVFDFIVEDFNQDGIINMADVDYYQRKQELRDLFAHVTAEAIRHNEAVFSEVLSALEQDFSLTDVQLDELLSSSNEVDREFVKNALLRLEISNWVQERFKKGEYVDSFQLANAFPSVLRINDFGDIEVEELFQSFLEENNVGMATVAIIEVSGVHQDSTLEELEIFLTEIHHWIGEEPTKESFTKFVNNQLDETLSSIKKTNEGLLGLHAKLKEMFEALNASNARRTELLDLFAHATAEAIRHNDAVFAEALKFLDSEFPLTEAELGYLLSESSDEERTLIENALLALEIHNKIIDGVKTGDLIAPFQLVDSYPNVLDFEPASGVIAKEPFRSFLESQGLKIASLLLMEVAVGINENSALEEMEIQYGYMRDWLGEDPTKALITSRVNASLGEVLPSVRNTNEAYLALHVKLNEMYMEVKGKQPENDHNKEGVMTDADTERNKALECSPGAIIDGVDHSTCTGSIDPKGNENEGPDQAQKDFDSWYASMKNNKNVVEMFNGYFPEGYDTLQAAKDLMRNAGWKDSWKVDCNENPSSGETTCWILKGDGVASPEEEMSRLREEEQKRQEGERLAKAADVSAAQGAQRDQMAHVVNNLFTSAGTRQYEIAAPVVYEVARPVVAASPIAKVFNAFSVAARDLFKKR